MDLQKLKYALVEFDGLTQSGLGAYANGLTGARMSRGLSGEVPFTAEEFHIIEDTLAAIRSLQESVPVPINWALVGKVKPFIDEQRRTFHDQKDPIAMPRLWFIRVNSTNWLKSMRGNDPVPTLNPESSGAAFESTDLVEEAVRRLHTLGVSTRKELLTAQRRSSSIIRTLEDLGFAAIGGEHGTDETKTTLEA